MTDDASVPLTTTFWEQRYQDGKTGWDLGQPAPPFVALLASDQAPPPGRIAVLGAGSGQDALLFADRGFEVVGFDLAPTAIATATQAARDRQLAAQFLQRDIFNLEPEFASSFDYVLEHTCFCAIAPALRSDYVQLVHWLLRPGGELIALFWAHTMPGGPPFGSTVEELHQRFTAQFTLVSWAKATHSVPSRQDAEYLGRFRRSD